MLKPLTPDESAWVEKTLAAMSLEECVGHLVCPEDRNYTVAQWESLAKEVPLGCVFFGHTEPAKLAACLEVIQANARVPVIVASDLEHGAGCMVEDCVDFPWSMAGGAAGDRRLMRAMGRATAREGRARGIHWTFSPVVDLNINFQNPVTNVRSLGDRPAGVARLAAAWIEGMQEQGLLAATAKHFPGDGVDDRDQHLCTSVNSLPFEKWMKSYGKVWRAVIDAGVMAVMAGHISLPDYEGCLQTPSRGMPATLSHRLQVDLLRGELGFEGVIVSDAAPMIGITSRVPANEEAVANILAGSDVYLFAEPREDYPLLLAAARTDRLSTERVRESVRRVLELKARLGLHRGTDGPEVTAREKASFTASARAMAEKSITVVRNDGQIPAHLADGAKVLTITIKHEEARGFLAPELTAIDEALRARGIAVDHLTNPTHREIIDKANDYDQLFVNLLVTPHSLVGTVRMVGKAIMPFWRSFWVDHPKVIVTSFGSPYHLYELPHLPNMVLAYGPSVVSQEAAVKVWLGEIEPQGKCPVKLPRQ